MATVEEKAGVSGETAVDTFTKSVNLAERRDRIIENFQTYFRVTYDELHAASTEETLKLRTGLAHISLTEEDISGWETFWEEARRMMDSAHLLYHDELMNTLLNAYNQQPRAVSMRIIQELSDKFRDPNVFYKEKEKYIREKLPRYLGEWKKVAKERRELLKDPQFKSLTPKDVNELGTFVSEDDFLTLKYPKRLALLQKVRAILRARSKGPDMEQSHSDIRKKLDALSTGSNRIMDPSKVAKWMDRIFSHFKTPAEVNEFMKGTFENFYIKNWRKVRVQFDTNESEMKKRGVPRGFPAVDLDTFLQCPYEQREAHVDEGKWRLEEGKMQNTTVSRLKMRIRHALYDDDWEGAEEYLAEATSIDADDLELKSMQNYLKQYRTDQMETKEEDPQKVMDDLRMIISGIEEPHRSLVIKPLEEAKKGPEAAKELNAILQMWGNLKWILTRGYWNEEMGQQDLQNPLHKERTKQYIEDGHSKGVEKNILDGDTNVDEAVRDECNAAQILYVDSSSPKATAEAIYGKVKRNKDDPRFGYWTTLIATNMSYARQEEIRSQVKGPLRTGLSFLIKNNLSFTLADDSGIQKLKQAG